MHIGKGESICYVSNVDKLAKIAALTGNGSEWRSNFEDVFATVNELMQKPSPVKKGNIFTLTYSAGCATLLQSLSAKTL